MKPYRVARADKVFMVQIRSASRIGRVRIALREFSVDIRSLWHYGAPFPTFLKLIASMMLCLFVVIPLVYPFFLFVITYFTFESLYLSWCLDEPWRFSPNNIFRRAVTTGFPPCRPQDMWKVKEVMSRGILLAHSLATSVDYLCVMQGLLDEA